MNDEIAAAAKAIQPQLIEVRRWFHQHPELSNRETKTAAEIARRLADLAGAPFIKVEASKFTEVGYVGRDVESMVRDLADLNARPLTHERVYTLDELWENFAYFMQQRIIHPVPE